MNDCTSYLYNFFKAPQQVVNTIAHELFNPILGQVDMVVGRGISGILPLISISIKTNIPSLVVRKENEHTHSECLIEGIAPLEGRYVIIDDFIDTGCTIREILSALNRSECVGIILYGKTSTKKYGEFPNIQRDNSIPHKIPIIYSHLYKIRK